MFFDPFFSSMGFIFVIFGLIIAVLWSLLPFAVFGIKHRLDRMIEELEKLNSKFAKLEREYYFHLQQKKSPEPQDSKKENNKKSEDNDNFRFMPKS